MFERARALGDVVRLAVPGRHPVFVLADPADIRHVLQENHSNYRSTPFHDRLKKVLGEGLATSEGELWRRQRRLLQPAFRAERIRRFVEAMGAAAAELADALESRGQRRAVLDVSEEMSNLTLEILPRCMFGEEPWAESVAIGERSGRPRSGCPAGSGLCFPIGRSACPPRPTGASGVPAPRSMRASNTFVAGRLGADRRGDDLLGTRVAQTKSIGRGYHQ